MSKKNRGANIFYPTRRYRPGGFPVGSHYIRVDANGTLVITHLELNPHVSHLTRSEARLLARRILQALEDTK